MKKIIILAGTALSLTMSTAVSAQEMGSETSQQTSDQEIDATRLAAAETTVDHLFPLGTYERMMKGTMDQLMDSMLAGVSGIAVGDIADAAGRPNNGMTEEEKAKSIGEIAKGADPYFEERMKISTKVMMNEMVDLMTTMEPAIRTALSKIYARKYSVSQLGEMNAFFATETGSAFARDYMMVFVDPEMMQSMMSMVPEMMSAMPDIMKKVEEATKHLSPPKNAQVVATEEAVEDMSEPAKERLKKDD
ncbi:hypothetical protein MNBD_ALPHA04-161 [hydrothermal vent metagenome]|uniref:DUF2059 domain-containing protein n=1 Tax=hydrothermal vent metagenome TaxID=652676 RepID=A0A3B0SWA5_9ZZZZ